MIPLATRSEILAAEAAYAQSCGPLSELMGRAGRRLAERAALRFGRGCVCVLCGGGNNGGDGFAAAAELLRQGIPALCFCTHEKNEGDAAAFRAEYVALGGVVAPLCEDTRLPEETAVIIDALLGTGLNRPPEGVYAAGIRLINSADVPVIAADVPSGVASDGVVFSPAVRATETVSFIRRKPAHYLSQSYALCGEIIHDRLGLPGGLLPAPDIWAMEEDDALEALPRRLPDSHKGNYPRVLLVVGAEGYAGAAIMAARAALRSGAGLVFCGVPRSIYPIVALGAPEAVVFPLPEEQGAISRAALPEILSRAADCDICLAGCGMSRRGSVQDVIFGLVSECECPLVLDADGINALSGHMMMLKKAKKRPIITPHMGELARLLGEDPLQGQLAPAAARRIAEKLGVILVMKGHRTVTASPEGQVIVNTTGNAGMARGGSGDVLAGMLAVLCAGAPTAQSAAAAVWLHGRAGDLAAARRGMTAMLPGDLMEEFPEAFALR
ncbi:MAG: NAD(P)H-hydrate dehydratase [Clostridia bacterium]|nr:NAD(P)H-hydrate dehydratase [Clostridia bacterium]